MIKKSTKIKKLNGKTVYLGNFNGAFELVLQYKTDFILEDMILGMVERRLNRKIKYDSGCEVETGLRDIEIFLFGNDEAKIISKLFDIFAISDFGNLLKVHAVETSDSLYEI